jgi:hypothetical protein
VTKEKTGDDSCRLAVPPGAGCWVLPEDDAGASLSPHRHKLCGCWNSGDRKPRPGGQQLLICRELETRLSLLALTSGPQVSLCRKLDELKST